jgi:DNA polymerase III subunit beta
MKLQATQENLSKALSTVARVANTRGTLPILANVLVTVSNNRLSFAATNLDIAITQYCGAKVSEEGSITVPARLMQDFISSLPSGVISLVLEETKLHITTDQYNSVINGVSAEDFPVMPAIEGGSEIEIPSDVLKRSLQQVVFAASNDEARPVLTGVYLHTYEGMLLMAATDSYRLGAKSIMKTSTNVDLLIPVSAMQDVLRILGDSTDPVRIVYNDQQVQFRVGDVELVARLIEGKYPPYQNLIPKTFTNTARIKRVDLMNITKVSSLFARESAGSVKIAIDENKKELSIHSIASQVGENTASAEGAITGVGEVTINSRYLLDALHAFTSDEIDFSFNGKLEPVVIMSPTEKDYTHLVMPLKS